MIDDGEIPSTNAPAPTTGFNRSYRITAFEISSCTRELQVASGGPGATVRVRFFQDCDDCQSLAAAGAPIADGFGHALSMPNQTGTTLATVGGFVIAGDLAQPGFCPIGDGTVFKNPGNLCAGLGNDDVYYREGSGTQTSGCQGLLGDPYGGFYLRVTAALGDCSCSPNDADHDGTSDSVDGCPLDAAKVLPGACGCGVADTDNDGIANCLDGCPTDPFKIAPGNCGCGVSDADADGDGLATCVDNCPPIFDPLQEDCDSDGVGDACELATSSFDVDADGQPDECRPGTGTSVCFGDGTGKPCPCGNVGGHGEGCRNTSGKGALLYNFGGASVSAHDTAIYVIHVPSNKFGLVYTGTGLVGGGTGVVFGDGLRCVDGSTKRFTVQNFGPVGAFTLINPVSLASAQLQPGTTWYFQAWFRDSIASPCAKSINLSNAFRIDFVN